MRGRKETMANSFYHIYAAVRQGFPLFRMTPNTKSVIRNFAVIQILPFLNNPKNLDLSYKAYLDFWHCFGRKNLHLIAKGIRYRDEIAYFFGYKTECFPSKSIVKM